MSPADNEEQLRAALGELQKRYPGWGLWATRDLGMVAASRIKRSAGLSPTVLADSVEQLAEALEREQNDAERYGLF